jgi:hypothetical protein
VDLTRFNPDGYNVLYGFPAYRVFIFGQEVTADVTAVTVQWQEGLQPGTCNITLANKNYRYTITHNDMLQIAKYRNVPLDALEKLKDNTMPKALQVPASEILARTNDYTAFNPIGDDDLAHDPSRGSQNIKQNVVSAKIHAGSMPLPDALEGEQVTIGQTVTNLPTPAYRFHFQVGKYIFHPMDPIRVFERDPYDPDVWYYMFSGLVSDIASSKDTSGDSTVTITAEQPSKLLRYARFTANPGLTDIAQLAVREGITADVAFISAYATSMAHLTVPEIMYAMMFGINAFGNFTMPNTIGERMGAIDVNNSVRGANQADLNPAFPSGTLENSPQAVETADTVSENVFSAHGQSVLRKRKWGVGHIKLAGSKIFIYGPTSTGTTQGATPNNPNSGLPLALGAPVPISQDPSASLETYQRYIDHTVRPSDAKDLYAEVGATDAEVASLPTTVKDTITLIGSRPDLYPVDGGRLIMLLPRDVAGQNSSITSIAFTASFALTTEWASRADIIAEVLERVEFSWYVSPKGDYIVEFPLYDFSPSAFGDYGAAWDIPLSDTMTYDTALSDAQLYTQAVCVPEIFQNYPLPASAKVGRTQAVILWHLIGMYGVRQAPISPRGYIATKAGARIYAHYSLNRLNSNTFTMDANVVPNLCLWLNRPVMMNVIDHYGTVHGITHNITWGTPGDMTTRMQLAYMRGWDGTINKQTLEKQYYTIGGVMGRPLNYALIFNPNEADIATPIPSGSSGEGF